MKEIQNKQFFSPLTGVRAIAAHMVYIHHSNPFVEKYFGKGIFYFTQELHIGVALFFVLSGFLIAYRYSEMKEFSFRKYMVNRIARIYPMYLMLTIVTFSVIVFTKNNDTSSNLNIFLLNVTFLRGYFNDFKFSGIAQGWSLTVEETFYLLAPLSFILISRSKIYLLVIPIVLILVGSGMVLVFSKIDFYGFFSSFEFMFSFTFFGRCFEFFTGIFLAIVFKKNILNCRFKFFTYVGVMVIILSVYCISLLRTDVFFKVKHPLGILINTFLLPLFGISLFFMDY